MEWKFVAVAGALLLSAGRVEARPPIHLASAETAITLEAGSEAPRLSQLKLRNGLAWAGEGPEPLIDHAESGGQPRRLQRKLNLSASQIGSSSVQLVYDSETPHLRLFWEWRVRAIHGPIEHSIRIENLGRSDLWLPLQDSFRFHWLIPAQEKLEGLWVEKGAGGPSEIGTHLDTIANSHEWSGESSTYAHPAKGQQRES